MSNKIGIAGTAGTTGKLITPTTGDLKALNIIRRDPIERLRSYLEALISADARKGAIRAKRLYALVGELVTKSFAQDVLPIQGEPTKSHINERLDKCVELVLALADTGWVSTRIIDELPRIYFGALRSGTTELPNRKSWGVKENNSVELDFTEENNDG